MGFGRVAAVVRLGVVAACLRDGTLPVDVLAAVCAWPAAGKVRLGLALGLGEWLRLWLGLGLGEPDLLGLGEPDELGLGLGLGLPPPRGHLALASVTALSTTMPWCLLP